MTRPSRWQEMEQVPAVRMALFLVGCLLLIMAPMLGVLPGPGGIVLFAAGGALVLRYSKWAKRKYVLFKRRFQSAGSWSDWALRRPSYRRREEQRRRLLGRCAAEAARQKELARIARHDGRAQLVLVRGEIGIAWFIERRFDPHHPSLAEPYWAAIGFSPLYADVETAQAQGLRALERAD